ncbi:hypothetical protein PHYC_01723 [Phycisphaerales bacterium]|nr:hypothetical protein PHYC_01723 [Phycisphaerales bacterium]
MSDLHNKPPFKLLWASLLILVLAAIAAAFLAILVHKATLGRPGETGARIHPIVLAGFFIALVIALAAYVTYIVLIFRMWKVVQDGHASLSPGAATALAAIPVVAFIGVFFAVFGLSRELNRVARERALSAKATEGLALAACICWVGGTLIGWIPILGCAGSLIGLIGNILLFTALFQMASAATAIVEAGEAIDPTA